MTSQDNLRGLRMRFSAAAEASSAPALPTRAARRAARFADVALAVALCVPAAPAFAHAAEADETASLTDLTETFAGVQENVETKAQIVRESAAAAVSKTLPYDPTLLAAIGSQDERGHAGCCPGFACAYGDAIIRGIARDHSYYGCGCCVWTDWGGGNSSFRSLGSNEALLREAYDQIAAGKPTVIHVMGASGQHWITLIGYQNVTDPDHLTLANFTALDPWDGAEHNPADRYTLYGDFCEHVSEA